MKATLEKTRITITCDGAGDRFLREVQFCRSMPDVRYDGNQKVWRIPATGAIAAQVVDYGAEVNQPLAALADLWQQPDIISDADVPEENVKSWRHQRAAYWFAHNKPAALLGMQMRTGKTKVAINLACNSDARRVVVLCPKVVVTVWQQQFAAYASCRWHVATLNTGSVRENADIATVAEIRHATDRLAIVINYESAWRPEMAKWFFAHDWDFVICDEIHRIKSPTGAASKFCYKLGQQATRRIGLTGTPLAHSPLDAFGIYRFLDVGIFGNSFVRFRNRYAQCNALFTSKVEKWLNQDELAQKMARISFRVLTADVLELPPVQHIEIPIKLEKKTRDTYDELSDDMVAMIGADTITAANALAKLLRLQQITGGWIKFDDHDGPTRLGSEKTDALADLLDSIDAGDPVVVFCRFSTDVLAAGQACGAAGRRHFELSGKRNQLADWLADRTGGVLIAQIQAGGIGIDLSKSCYGVYYSLGYSLADYEQSLFRLQGSNQTRPIAFYHLIADDTVDQQVYAALQQRREVVSYVVESLKTLEKISQNS